MITIGNYPEEWLEIYQNNNYLLIDPVIKHCTYSTLPYNWKGIYTKHNKEVTSFASGCSGFGLKEGFSLGLNGNSGDSSLLNVGGSKSAVVIPANLNQAIITIHILLPYLHEKMAQINPVKMLYPTDNQQYPHTP